MHKNNDEALDFLIHKIHIINQRSLKTILKTQKPRKDWITPALINTINIKNKLYKVWKNDPADSVKKERYLNYESRLKSLLRTAKDRHDQNQIQGANSKRLWQYVHCKLDHKTKNPKINGIMINNSLNNDDLCKANFFNEFFSTVISRLSNSATPPQQIHRIPDIPFNQHTLFLFTTNELEITKIISQLMNKAGGCNGIHAVILKLAAPYIAPVLAHIINNAISQGTCPRHFKSAEICPVYKDCLLGTSSKL